MSRVTLLFVVLLACASGCDGVSGGVGKVTVAVAGGVESAPAGSEVALEVRVTGASPGTVVTLRVRKGGGSLAESKLTFDEGGTQSVAWTLGPAPVAQQVQATVEDVDASVEASADVSADTGAFAQVHATRDTPLEAQPFGDVHAVLTAAKVEGSTEDLAFSPTGGALFLGVPGGIARLDPKGKTTLMKTTGDPLDAPLGVAFADDGALWICDSKGRSLRRMDPAGVVTTVVTEDQGAPLGAPNHLAVLPSGDMIMSDPCLGRLLWIDGKTGEVKARHGFDLATEGGPNGVALSPEGDAVVVTTENTGLLCNHSAKVAIDKNVAGLFKIALDDGAFGARTALATEVGLFADGLAFDSEGNLYVCIDRVENFKLTESVVEVLPAGGTKLLPFLRATDRVFANVLFGTPAFGDKELFVALLAVPPFTGADKRGVMRVGVGITGHPLGHVALPGS